MDEVRAYVRVRVRGCAWCGVDYGRMRMRRGRMEMEASGSGMMEYVDQNNWA